MYLGKLFLAIGHTKSQNYIILNFKGEVILVLEDSELNIIVFLYRCQNRTISLSETELNLLFSYLPCTVKKYLCSITCLTAFQHTSNTVKRFLRSR